MKKRNQKRRVGISNRHGAFRRAMFETLEVRQMLAGDSGRQVLVLPEANAPAISDVFVSSPAFGTRFSEHLVNAGLGTQEGFLRVASGSPNTFPWAMNRIRVRFTENVDVVMNDISIRGVNSQVIEPLTFQYDAAKFEATWNIPIVSKDKLEFTLSNHVQSKQTGRFVDGKTNDTDPSSPFVYAVNVLLGDVSRNGLVTSVDVNPIRDSLFSTIVSPNYNIYNDTSGDGRITSVDVNAVRDNLFSRLPSGAPASQTGQLMPGISRIAAVNVDEDAGLQTILFAANTSAGPVSGQSDLQFSISSSNAQLVDGAAASVTRIGNHYALQFRSRDDQFGQTQLTVGVTDAAGTTAPSFNLQVQPVNDAPRVVNPPPSVVLSTTSPSAFLDLYNHFSDVDNAALIFEILDSDGTIVTTSLNGSLLHIESSARLNASTEILVQAKDEFGLHASTNINVVLQNKFLQPSAQVVPSSTSVTVPLPDLLISPNQLTIKSSNSTLLPASSFQLTQVAGGAELTISNPGSEYGASYVTIEHDGGPLAGFVAMLMPSPAVTTGPTDPKLQVSLTPTQSSGDSTFQTLKKTVDDRAVVWLYHQGVIDSVTALAMLEPDFRAYSRGDVRMLPTVSQLSARYSVAQAYWNAASEGSSYWLDAIDEVWSGYQDLTGVAAAVQNRNPRSDVRDFLKDQKSTSFFTSLSIAISEVDPTSEPDLFSELVDSMNKQIATFARAQHSAYNGDDVQSAVLATEFVVDSSIGK